MSKNKDIKALHQITDLPYKECRALMKKHKWDFLGALCEAKGINLNFNITGITEAIKAFSDNLGEFINSMADIAVKAVSDILDSGISDIMNKENMV